MKGIFRVLLVGVVSTGLAAGSVWALFGSDADLAAAAKVTMQDAIRKAQEIIPGTPLKVEMGKVEGHVLYEIKILDKEKKTRWVYVDAADGHVQMHPVPALPGARPQPGP